MNRRSFIGSLAGVSITATAGCLGGNSKSPQNETQAADEDRKPVDPDEVTEEAKQVKDLASEFHGVMDEYYEDSRVFIKKNGEIVLEFTADAESPDAVESEIHNIIDEFIDLVDSPEEATTLTAATSKVQGIAPEPAVKKYAKGELERDALHETVEFLPL